MIFTIAIILLILSIILQGTLTPLPLALVCLLCFAILKKDAAIFFIALLTGIFLDVVTVQSVGSTSLFFLTFLVLVFLYQRKYEIDSYLFVMIAAFIGSWAYLALFGYNHAFIYSLINSIIAVLLFGIVTVSQKLQHKNLRYK